jgi:hypothetical protein
MVLKYHETEETFPRIPNNVADQLGEIQWDNCRHEITASGIFFRSSVSDSKPNFLEFWYIECTAAKFRRTWISEHFRRRAWETRHSGATGWELLSHFSDVWCSSLLQLTRSSTWQWESLFRCQMWPHWMYVSNNTIRKEN